MKKQIYRQGDVLIVRINALPKGLYKVNRENGRVILAHSEVTGHAHALVENHVDLYSQDGQLGNVTYLEVREAMAALAHDEHATIKLPIGHYKIVRQREYSPEAIRNVQD